MRRGSSFFAKSVRYNIFTNGTPYASVFVTTQPRFTSLRVGRPAPANGLSVLSLQCTTALTNHFLGAICVTASGNPVGQLKIVRASDSLALTWHVKV